MILISACPSYLIFVRLWVLLHTLIAVFFTAALVWRWYRSREAAVAGGVIAGFNGFFTARVPFQHHLASAAWLPAVIYFLEIDSYIGMGFALALQWLAGYPTFSLLTGLFALVVSLDMGKKGLLCLFRAGLLAMGLAAVQWVPFLQFLALSQRGFILNSANALQFSIPPLQLLKEIFVPMWFGIFQGIKGDPAMVCFYVGIAAVAMAIRGLARGRREKILGFFTMACLVLSVGGYIPGYGALPFFRLFRYPCNWLFPASFGFCLLAASGIARTKSKFRWPAAAAVAVELLIFAQFVRVAWADPRFLSEPPPLVRQIQSLPQPTRIYHSAPLMSLWARGMLRSPSDYAAMKNFLAPSYGTAFGLQEISNFQTMQLRRSDDYCSRLAAAGPKSPLLNWAGASVIITAARGATRVDLGTLRAYRNPDAEPRVFYPNRTRGGTVKIEDYGPGHVRALTQSARPGAVVFSEIDYPGWRAFLDGRPVPHERWADAFLALEVPAGRHEIAFRYQPAVFWFGLALTALTLAWIMFFLISRRDSLRA